MTNKANLIAAATFVVGMAGFQSYAFQLKKNLQGGEPTGVLVVTQDLSPGDLLTGQSLGVMEVPSDYVDARRVLRSERGNLVGVAVQSRLKAGEGLVWSDIADGAAHRHLAALVSPGRRAYSLGSEANPLGGLLRVGDHVDVLLESKGKSAVLLQRILILAVGAQVGMEELEGSALRSHSEGVTLSLSVEQSAQLLSAESRGDLRLVLRNPGDLKKELSPPSQGRSVAKIHRDIKSVKSEDIEHVR